MSNPFKKGFWGYELQILMIIFLFHDDNFFKRHDTSGIWIGRLHIWYDKQWLLHGIFGKIRFFLISLTRNANQYRRPQAKARVIWINAKHMFKNWARKFKAVKFYLSLVAYLRLYKAGFSISNTRMRSTPFEINRFYWKGKMIREMPDIDRVGDRYNTIQDGHVEPLGVTITFDESVIFESRDYQEGRK